MRSKGNAFPNLTYLLAARSFSLPNTSQIAGLDSPFCFAFLFELGELTGATDPGAAAPGRKTSSTFASSANALMLCDRVRPFLGGRPLFALGACCGCLGTGRPILTDSAAFQVRTESGFSKVVPPGPKLELLTPAPKVGEPGRDGVSGSSWRWPLSDGRRPRVGERGGEPWNGFGCP